MLNLSREQWAGAWCAAVLILCGVAAAAGVGVTLSNAAVGLVALLAPPSVMLLVWRGPPPQNVTEMLYDARRSKKDAQ